jgi:hypothetical protein
MNRRIVSTYKRMSWTGLLVLAASFSLPAAAAPKPGHYCPGTDILLVAAEEISASLDLAMRSRTALINNDLPTAIHDINSSGTALRLAASRGAAARTTLLIDTVIQTKTGDDYPQMLAWFPLLHTSLLTLPDDAAVRAAGDRIGRSEDILQGDEDGDAVAPLKEARDMLTCDGLDIPLKDAMQAQETLSKHLNPKTKTSDYDTLIDSMRRALAYTLGKGEKKIYKSDLPQSPRLHSPHV